MILLTALPRTGKSTAIKKIVNMLGNDNCGGFYTEEIREDGERVNECDIKKISTMYMGRIA